MTETEWASCTDPGPMMGLLQGGVQPCERTSRLFACACVRRIWPFLPDHACGNAVDAAERFADGTAGIEELATALAALDFSRRLRGAAGAARTSCWHAAFDARAASRLNAAYGGGGAYEWGMSSRAAGHAREAAVRQAASEAQRSGRPARQAMRAAKDDASHTQADLLRDLFGPNPLRPATAEPSWLTAAVVALARAAYDERILPGGHLDPARLAVLADALEEVGADADLLAHLRGPRPHVRGCHILDLLTGRS